MRFLPLKVMPTLAAILEKFGNLKDHRELFDSASSGIQLLLKSTALREISPPMID